MKLTMYLPFAVFLLYVGVTAALGTFAGYMSAVYFLHQVMHP